MAGKSIISSGKTVAPSPWVAHWASAIAQGGPQGGDEGGAEGESEGETGGGAEGGPAATGWVLDLAAGGGRHTRYLRALGFRVVAVDRDVSGLADLAADPGCEVIEADLEAEPSTWPLGARTFAAIVVTNYLHRPLFPQLIAALAPGGLLIYETFAQGNERLGRPKNPHFLLHEDELRAAFGEELEILAAEQVVESAPRPAVRQRLCARKPAK